METFYVVGDPVRRRILELLSVTERTSGEVVEVIQEEFGITQAAVSQHLKVLRENGFASVRAEGARRIYAVDVEPLQAIDKWLSLFRNHWTPRLDALSTEISRGKRQRRRAGNASHSESSRKTSDDGKSRAGVPRARRQ